MQSARLEMRRKKTAESEALAELQVVTGNKAKTDRAAKLDTEIVALRGEIEHAGPVLEVNSQGKALARLWACRRRKRQC